MLKSLMLSVLSVVGVGAPVVYNGGVTEVTYVAETNDVNSIDDLVEGNIYHFSYDNPQSFGPVVFFTYGIYNHKTTSTMPTHMFLTTFDFTDVKDNYYLRYYSNATDIYISVFDSNPFSLVGTIYSIHNNYEDITNISFDFIYRPMPVGGNEILPINNISRCENIPILSVSHQENEGLFNILTEFINTNIFTGGVMDSVNFEVLGSSFTLGSYLSLITTIIILGLIIYLLIRLVYWVGCLFTKSFRGQ